jgi:hypothetical protein
MNEDSGDSSRRDIGNHRGKIFPPPRPSVPRETEVARARSRVAGQTLTYRKNTNSRCKNFSYGSSANDSVTYDLYQHVGQIKD